MERRSVQSSHIKSFGYDEKDEVLEVEFLDGAKYTYAGVPKDTFHRCCNASSPGKFFHSEVRGVYDGKRK